jgi:hypothetical protein
MKIDKPYTKHMSTPSHKDKVALKANLLPHAHHIGAPQIKPTDLTPFIRAASYKVNKALQRRAQEIINQIEELQQEYKLNQEVYSAKCSFEPIVGECYHLYQSEDGSRFMSLISPSQWSKPHLYSVILNADYTWSKV